MLIQALNQEIQRYQSVIEQYEKAIHHAHTQVRLLENLRDNYQSDSEQLLNNIQAQTPTSYVFAASIEEDSDSEEEAISIEDDILPENDNNTNLTNNNSSQEKTSSEKNKHSKTIESLRNKSFSLIGEYAGMPQINAIGKLLGKNPDEGYEAGFIARELYGHLSKSETELAIRRIRSALTTGCNQGNWFRVKYQPGFYSLKR